MDRAGRPTIFSTGPSVASSDHRAVLVQTWEDEAVHMYEFTSGRQFALPDDDTGDRRVVTVLMTDIVDSTVHLARRGDRRWRELLIEHNARVRGELDRFRGPRDRVGSSGCHRFHDGWLRRREWSSRECPGGDPRRAQAAGAPSRTVDGISQCDDLDVGVVAGEDP